MPCKLVLHHSSRSLEEVGDELVRQLHKVLPAWTHRNHVGKITLPKGISRSESLTLRFGDTRVETSGSSLKYSLYRLFVQADFCHSVFKPVTEQKKAEQSQRYHHLGIPNQHPPPPPREWEHNKAQAPLRIHQRALLLPAHSAVDGPRRLSKSRKPYRPSSPSPPSSWTFRCSKMNGFESSRAIRDFAAEKGLPPSRIIALDVYYCVFRLAEWAR